MQQAQARLSAEQEQLKQDLLALDTMRHELEEQVLQQNRHMDDLVRQREVPFS